ncbi:MAG: hypothetical protein MN733_24575 [Nitrososphaera sp.]|nr:hypothetical protein [Nitrososphaera sp.]
MFIRRIRASHFLMVFILLSACSPSQPTESIASAPLVGPVIPFGESEVRDLSPTTEVVSNCGSGGGTVIKHPSMSVVTTYAVEWEVGGTTGVGVTIGEGVVPGGVNLSSTLEGRYATQFDQGIQQTTAWELPAEPGTVVDYTLMWREVWQPGYVEIRLADESIVKANVRYRIGIQSDIVGKRVENCSGEPITTQVYPITPPQTPVSTTEPFCAFVTQGQIEELKTFQDVASAIRKAEEFAGYRQNDYTEGSTIPAGVLIATDLLSTNLEQFGVIPINNGGGWGLFLTTREFQAPNAGTYWCIQETEPGVLPPPSPTVVSRRICGDNEGAFQGELNTPNPLFWRPEGFVSGWLSSDPATIVLPDGTSKTLDSQFVLVVQDLPWVQVDGVSMANGKAQTWGCWYTTNQFVEQDAVQDMCIKKEDGSFGILYRVSEAGVEELGTTQTVSCP